MEKPRVPIEDIARFARAIFQKHEMSKEQTDSLVRNIVWNESVGRHNFGLQRLSIYLERLRKKAINPSPELATTRLSSSSFKLSGDNAFGQFAGETGMNLAISGAQKNGTGICTVSNSNFYGTGAYFVNQACNAHCLGFAMSNSYPKVAAMNGATPVLGTNPMAFGSPGRNNRHFLLDFATSAAAGSTIRQFIQEGRSLPPGIAVSSNGQTITDPAQVKNGAILPFGGAKGFGLSMMVELLSGVLSGAGVSYGVGSTYTNFERPADNGHIFIAIDATKWMPFSEYLERSEKLLQDIRNSGENDIRLPGDQRFADLNQNMKYGVPFDHELFEELLMIARQQNVVPLRTVD